MTPHDDDARWMQRALELARRGIALTSPNPAVGCVILDNSGQVIGEGWHEYDLRDHAEIAALKAAAHHTKITSARETASTVIGCHHVPFTITNSHNTVYNHSGQFIIRRRS